MTAGPERMKWPSLLKETLPESHPDPLGVNRSFMN
jgi:hypothetical protein